MAFLPIVRPQELIRAIKKQGFVKDRQSGSHAVFIHADGRRVSVPIHRKTLGKGLLKRILRDLGITPSDLKKLL